MEKFRDHEKEYKSKKPTKAAMQNETEIKGKFNYGSGSDFDGDYGDDDFGTSDEEINGVEEGQDILIDKQWLASLIAETLKGIIAGYDAELEKI